MSRKLFIVPQTTGRTLYDLAPAIVAASKYYGSNSEGARASSW
jgi:hypothetical protein